MSKGLNGVGEFIQEYGGWLVGLLTVIGTFLYNSRKVQVDESAMVLGKWKELVEAHQRQIGSLESRISQLESALREAQHEIRELRDENAGLKRQIAQNSQAHAFELTRVKKQVSENQDLSEATEKFRQAGHNSEGSGK